MLITNYLRALGAVSLLSLLALLAVNVALVPPVRPCPQTRYDALIVLGCVARPDGTPTPELAARLRTALALWRAGRARHIIVTGGAVYSGFPEARAMARYLHQHGVPDSLVLPETRARNTAQNARYALILLRRHGGRSALVVSTESHLRRSALLFGREGPGLCLAYAGAPWPPGTPWSFRLTRAVLEYLLTTWYALHLPNLH